MAYITENDSYLLHVFVNELIGNISRVTVIHDGNQIIVELSPLSRHFMRLRVHDILIKGVLGSLDDYSDLTIDYMRGTLDNDRFTALPMGNVSKVLGNPEHEFKVEKFTDYTKLVYVIYSIDAMKGIKIYGMIINMGDGHLCYLDKDGRFCRDVPKGIEDYLELLM